MPILIGRNVPAVATTFFVDCESKLKVRDVFGNSYDICIGLDYKHLGSYKDAKRNKSREFGYRIGEDTKAAQELFRATRRATVATENNWQLAVALSVSRLCYDVDTDEALTEPQWRRITTAYDGLARRAVSRFFFHKEHRHTSSCALAACRALPLKLHVLFLMLGYLGRILSTAPPFLLAAIDVLARECKLFYCLVRSDLVCYSRIVGVILACRTQMMISVGRLIVFVMEMLAG